MTKRNRAFLELHIAVFLFGFAAIFGELISVSALSMVWWRLLMSIGLFLFFKSIYSEIKSLAPKQIYTLLGIGVIIGVHWVCFYGSIKLANASIGLICFSATPFFTAVIEPLFRKTPWKKVDFFLGVCVTIAMSFILNTLDFSMYQGVLVGIIAALLAAVFISLNKKYIDVAGPVTILVIEMFGALLFLSFVLPFVYYSDFSKFVPVGIDWTYLMLLVVFCTMLSFTLQMRSLKHVSAFTSNFVISLEPVYGIVLAMIILKEHKELNAQFYLGVIALILLVVCYPLIKKKWTN